MAPIKTEMFYCADWVTKQSAISRAAVTTSGFLSYRYKNHNALSGSLSKKHKPTWTHACSKERKEGLTDPELLVAPMSCWKHLWHWWLWSPFTRCSFTRNSLGL